jgi:NAD(P)-dependent dehydrogenase (short-subunit alcohol dehydrogenase family)
MKERPVAIITGAANGIGRATAAKFAAKSYAVAMVDIDGGGLKKAQQELQAKGMQVLPVEGDLQQPAFLEQIVQQTIDKWGRLDVLINNAAWRTLETMRTISLENWDKAIRINLTAPAFLARHSAAVMEKNKTKGVIVNISSVMSARVAGTSPAYIASKGAIESLTYELASLYGPSGIRVVAINPGNVETQLSNDYADKHGNNISRTLIENMHASTPLGRSASPEEIAHAAFWLCSAEASFITGTSLLVDGGFLHNFNSYPMKKIQFPGEF